MFQSKYTLLTEQMNIETIFLGGGCFWCIEAAYSRVSGVISAQSGYMGGAPSNANYSSVCSGNTDHAEVVEVTYDPTRVSTHDLLQIFFVIHDPTTLNRQGADIGSQYRSIIYFLTEEQRSSAASLISELTEAVIWPHPIVTVVAPAMPFYKAEIYHESYYDKNPMQPYCQAVIAPKLQKLKARCATFLTSD